MNGATESLIRALKLERDQYQNGLADCCSGVIRGTYTLDALAEMLIPRMADGYPYESRQLVRWALSCVEWDAIAERIHSKYWRRG